MAQRLNIDIVAKDKSKQALSRVQGSLAKVKGAVFNLRNAFIGLGAGLVLRSIVKTGIQIENLGVQLKALFGSAKEGRKALEIVTKFAKTTPFELENIQQGITALATVRKQAEQAGVSFEELLKITGNTATVLGGDFALASLQIQRSFSAGIASAELFRERGVTAMAGFTQGVRTNVQESIKGLAKAFGTGGEFGNLIEELSRTLSGTISNLKDTLFMFQVAITRGFFFELKEQLGDLKAFTEDNAEALEHLGVSIGEKFAVAIIKTSEAIKALVQNFRQLQAILGLLLIAFGGMFQKIAGGLLIFDDLNRRIKKLVGDVEVEFQKIKKFEHELSIPIENITEELGFTLQKIKEFEHELSVNVPTNTQKVISKFKELNNDAINKLKNELHNISTTIAEGINSGITKVSESLSRTIILGEKLSDTFKKMAQDILLRVLSGFIEMGIRLAINLALEQKQVKALITKLGIEKLITREKQTQASIKSSGSGSSFAGNLLGSFLPRFFSQGGAVSKGQPTIVGEKGAEMFVPNQTGQITQSARGTGGSPVNVNFAITTLDATGFQDMLVQNRGTISNIINQAVNERGGNNLV